MSFRNNWLLVSETRTEASGSDARHMCVDLFFNSVINVKMRCNLIAASTRFHWGAKKTLDGNALSFGKVGTHFLQCRFQHRVWGILTPTIVYRFLFWPHIIRLLSIATSRVDYTLNSFLNDSP